MSVPKLSVIIPTYNRPKKLATTIACFQKQTLQPDQYEIVVVDDGSNPPVVLPEPCGPARCSLIRFDEVLERAVARNTAVERARGEYVLFSDDDLEVEPDFLAAHLRAHEEWPGAVVIGKIILPPAALRDPGVRFRQRLEHTGLPAERGPVPEASFCTAANMSVSRRRYLELNGFEPGLVGIEDQDFGLRHAADGGLAVFLPEAVAVHNDDWLDFGSFCRRQQWGSECTVALRHRYPDLPANQARHLVNGPIRWGRDSAAEIVWKTVKRGLANPVGLAGLRALTRVLEKIAPNSAALDRVYRAVLGVYILRGYRRGLRRAATATVAAHLAELPPTDAVPTS